MSKGPPQPRGKLVWAGEGSARCLVKATGCSHISDPAYWMEGRTVLSTVAGSFRRRAATVRDLDLVVVLPHGFYLQPRHASHGMEFVDGGRSKQEWAHTRSGVPVELYFASIHEYGACLLYATGSAGFNKMVRAKAKRRGMKLNRSGLWMTDGTLVAAHSERAIFEALDMDYIHPKDRS